MTYLILTSITVSIDSFFCGISFGLHNGRSIRPAISISLIVYILCSFVNVFAFFLDNLLYGYAGTVGGIILVLTACVNLIKSTVDNKKTVLSPLLSCGNGNGFYQEISAGFAVGFDGATANLSLALMGMNGFYVPIVIAVFHAVAIMLGIKIASLTRLEKIGTFLSPLILAILGFIKIIGI